jgi:transcription elongation factor Elf1
MKRLSVNRNPRLFPCCVCGEPREVRMTKKGKPYMICDPCGVQMFVRVETGIRRFEQLVADADRNDVWKRLAELQQRYEFLCPRCGPQSVLQDSIGV